MHLTTTLVFAVALVTGPQHPAMPAGMSHDEHLKAMQKDAALQKRGADAMGFDQNATAHHFRLTATGGSIEVEVLRSPDATLLTQVRTHLHAIAGDFGNGDFARPFATHAEVPPGVVTMQQRRLHIRYLYEDTPLGGRVAIQTTDSKSLEAIHAFLRYQIAEHKTGDSPTSAPVKNR
jgi:hypothetical protein